MSAAVTLDDLRKEREGGAAAPSIAPATLHLGDLHTVPEVFQPRHGYAPEWDVQQHVAGIAAGIREGQREDPVTVWWSGSRWIVIDGHSRLAAYREARAKENRAVPVQVLEGDAYAAFMECVEANTRAKLDVSEAARTAAAWRLVAYEIGSLAKIAAAAGVGTRTVSRMRGVRAKLADERRMTSVGLEALGWGPARQLAEGVQENRGCPDEWIERLVAEMAKKLTTALKGQPQKMPEVLGRAVERAYGRTPMLRALACTATADELAELLEAARAAEAEAEVEAREMENHTDF